MADAPSRAGFVRAALVPALWIFALPLFALWFGHHVEVDYDDQLRASALQSVAEDSELTDEERAAASEFYGQLSGAAICASDDPELAPLRDNLSEVCNDYLQFSWMQRLGGGSILLGLLTGLLAAGAAGAAFASRKAQIPAFRFGWNLMRVTSAAQTVVQGVLLVALSFWVTAFWFHIYVLKLILVVAVLAVVGIGAALKAIFTKVEVSVDVEGAEISPQQAPMLWARLKELAGKIGTAPPGRIIGGIDDNFFVTEGTVKLEGAPKLGRTLYVSLGLLRTLNRQEADAVLSHELAHFSGGDTAHTLELAPMEARYARYLEILHANPISLPVYFPMLAFWKLFHLASAAAHRERELRADRVAAEQTSPSAVANALLKIASYATYRGEVERDLFSQNKALSSLGIAERVASGFSSFVRSNELRNRMQEGQVPHPLDSHPPNPERYAALGVGLPAEKWSGVLLAPVEQSWAEAIDGAADIEAKLWARYEARFALAHEFQLALKTTPRTAEERTLVERHFPPLRFPGKDGRPAAELNFQTLNVLDGEGPVDWESIGSALIEDGMLGKVLILRLGEGRFNVPKKKIKLKQFENGEAFLAAFNRYWGRSQVAKKNR